MKKIFIIGLMVVVGIIILSALVNNHENNNDTIPVESEQATQTIEQPAFEYAQSTEVIVPDGMAIATFSGGCFWCVEAVFQETDGVDDVISGFAGGEEVAPTYNQVVSGLTGHRESIQFTYDPAVISYSEILDIFWQSIDPTDAGGQFVDRGFIYTTAVFYHDDAQQAATTESIKALQSDRDYADIATEVLPFTTFYPAEDYHQDYYKKSADRYKQYESTSGRPEYKSSLMN